MSSVPQWNADIITPDNDASAEIIDNGGLVKDENGAVGVKVDNATVSINDSGAIKANLDMLYNILGVQEHMPESIPSGYIRVKYRTGLPSSLLSSGTAIFYSDHPDTVDLNQTLISGDASHKAYMTAPNQFDILGGVIVEQSSGNGLQLRGATGLITATGLSYASGVTKVNQLFRDCTNLVSADIDTTGLTDGTAMFSGCTSLQTVPLLNTATMTKVGAEWTSSYNPGMFGGCVNVESGALALYQQMSTQATPPSTTVNCFTNCGRDTVTGAAELAQIPSSWGGTGA